VYGTLLLRIEVSAGALAPNLIIAEKEARKEDLPDPRWVPNGADGEALSAQEVPSEHR
jgi:hypothetical protein